MFDLVLLMKEPHAHIKNAGLKVTQPREEIFRILSNAQDKHLSAEEVFKALNEANIDVGLATVYRVLAQFEAAGLITKLYLEPDYAVYEMAGDTHHDHLICVTCGKVVEFVDAQIELRQKNIATEHGFALTNHVMILYGKCYNGACSGKR